MRPIFCAVLACLLLCGCAAQTPEPTEAAYLREVIPTEPPGSYVPGSPLELASGGAVRYFPQQGENIGAIRRMGQDLLLFSADEMTKLTRLSGENLFQVAEKQLDILLPVDAPSLYISDDWVIYYDSRTMEQVHLDGNLRETMRVAMPADLQGQPVMTRDRSKLYYCTVQGLRALDMETGISRLVKEMSFREQVVCGLLLGDSLLQVYVCDDRGNSEILFLDAATGALMGTLPENMELTAGASFFYAVAQEGLLQQMIFGTAEEICQLHPADYRDAGIFLPDSHAAVIFHREEDSLTLEYYQLESGLRTATLDLGKYEPRHIIDGGDGVLYFLIGETDGSTSVCRWDTTVLTTGDEKVYTGDWYTFSAPDTEGLARCSAYAESLRQQFGLDIQLITEAITLHPEGHDLIPEYQVPVLMDGLTRLEAVLRQYPEDMFPKAVEDMENGKLSVLLVRDIRGGNEVGNACSMDGLYFWEESHSYVAIAVGDDMEGNLYHQLFHAMESRLLSRSIACYRWDELNPKGFDYDYDYITNQSRDVDEYLEDATRSFIDTFSMRFPKEDRARVMEYACMPGNENYFISYTMQKKLLALCEGIREAYDLESYPQPLLWEQYLESPIAP